MNLCQGFPLIIIITTLLLLILGTKPWEAPKDNKQRWFRSLLTGIGAAIIVISGFALIGLNQSTGNCLKDIQNLNLGYWACIGIPVFVIVTIGNYVGYRQIIWLHSERKKIDNQKK